MQATTLIMLLNGLEQGSLRHLKMRDCDTGNGEKALFLAQGLSQVHGTHLEVWDLQVRTCTEHSTALVVRPAMHAGAG